MFATLIARYEITVEARSSEVIDLPALTAGQLRVDALIPTKEHDVPAPADAHHPQRREEEPAPEPQYSDVLVEVLHQGAVTVHGRGHLTQIVSDAAGQWQIRLHNDDRSPRRVTVTVSYPSARSVLTRTIPFRLLNSAFSRLWNSRPEPALQLRIDDNIVTLRIADDIADANDVPATTLFELGKLEVPTLGNDITISDLSTTRITLLAHSLLYSGAKKRPCVTVTIELEDGGTEVVINNAPNFDLRGIRLVVSFFFLHVTGPGRLVVHPKASFRIKEGTFAGAPWVSLDAGAILDAIRARINDAIETKLRSGRWVARIEKSLAAWFVGGDYEVHDVRTDGTNLLVDYVEPLAPPFAEPPAPVTPRSPGNLAKIDHIVVLMMENRSFDHLLGYLSRDGHRADIDGLAPIAVTPYPHMNLWVTSRGAAKVVAYPFAVGDTVFDPGPCHDFGCVAEQLGASAPATMSGFISSYAQRAPEEAATSVMGYHGAANVPVYDYLAREFGVCDRWFAAHAGPTLPNRFLTLMGHLMRNREGGFITDNPTTRELRPIDAVTLFDHLTERDVSWKYFEHNIATLRIFSKYTWDTRNVVPIEDSEEGFYASIAGDRLPAVSFIDPSFAQFPPGNDDHPPADLANGQALVRRVVDALMSNATIWASTLLIITYDEHGGFYDHVPPAAPRGVRVPAFVVSPHVPRGAVSHVELDHLSIAATVLRRFCSSNLPDMGARADQANDLGALLSLPQARSDIPRYGESRSNQGDVTADHVGTGATKKGVDVGTKDLAQVALPIPYAPSVIGGVRGAELRQPTAAATAETVRARKMPCGDSCGFHDLMHAASLIIGTG